jgi:hypothetical protein
MAIMEMKIKTTLRFHLSPVRMALRTQTTNVGEDEGQMNLHTLLVGMCASTTTMENRMEAL